VINYNVFANAKKRFPKTQTPFLNRLYDAANDASSLSGVKILQNIPFTIEAAIKIESLLLRGADVTMTAATCLPPQEEAFKMLKAANVKVELDHSCCENEYDIYLDCGAELYKQRPPKLGTVELTQSGTEIYKKFPFEHIVVSVDDSDLKYLETFFGTGDGFVRALKSQQGATMYNEKFVVFGYGKVGRGIVHALLKYTDDVVIVEPDPIARKAARKKGVKVLDVDSIEEITKHTSEAHCVVTATGIRNLLTDYYNFSKSDFNKAVLANMGAYDEFGDNFEAEDVLYGKKPFNFSISEPTLFRYLDPVFYAHNIGIDLLLSKKLQKGYNPFPTEIASSILKDWFHFHDEKEIDMSLYLAHNVM
jgi:adenosylhomocysteinase